MDTKPLSPRAHGIIDYGLTAALAIVPPAIGLNKNAVNLYRVLSVNLTVYNALTDHGAAIKPVIPREIHHKVDYFNLALVAGLGFTKAVSKQKKALLFHAGFVALATATVLLTDWDKGRVTAIQAHAPAPYPVIP